MKATAKAPANIAFIKYWGKTDPELRVPQNNSISMNLSGLYSICTVEFNTGFTADEISFLDEDTVKESEINRIKSSLNKIRSLNRSNMFARIITKNNFPKATGIASSASGFASLALAAITALGIKLTSKELSKLARQLSGTACRSIPDGFVEWEKGSGPEDSYAKQLLPVDYWDICDVVAIVSKKMKKVSTTEGHALSSTSPFYKTRIDGMDEKVRQMKIYMKECEFSRFGRLVEDEALNMHAICLTSTPPLIYWEPTTIEIMKKVTVWREAGDIESYFTIDAGSTVHIICEEKTVPKLEENLKEIKGIERIVVNHPAVGARLVDTHLF